MVGLFVVLLPTLVNILLPAIWKSHIMRLLHAQLANNSQEELHKKEGKSLFEMCEQMFPNELKLR